MAFGGDAAGDGAPTRWDNADPGLEHPYPVRKHVAAVVAHEPEAEPRQGAADNTSVWRVKARRENA